MHFPNQPHHPLQGAPNIVVLLFPCLLISFSWLGRCWFVNNSAFFVLQVLLRNGADLDNTGVDSKRKPVDALVFAVINQKKKKKKKPTFRNFVHCLVIFDRIQTLNLYCV
jgi:hypothetical protein